MKSKLKLFSIVVPCLSVLVASALAQTFGTNSQQSTDTPATIVFGQRSSSGTPGAATSADNAASFAPFAPDFMPPPQLEGQTPSPYSKPATFYGGNWHDWRVHNEDAAIAPLVQQLKTAKSDSEVEKLKGQLDEALEKSFAMRQKRHTQEIEDLEAKVKALKDLVGKRQEKRREIIANRRDQILRESQGLGW